LAGGHAVGNLWLLLLVFSMGATLTQLFDQMTVPDPLPELPRPVDVDLELHRIFSTPAPVPFDVTGLSSARAARRAAPRPRRELGPWLRSQAPGVLLVVAGAALGVAVARL
jgi:hypothetical protein